MNILLRMSFVRAQSSLPVRRLWQFFSGPARYSHAMAVPAPIVPPALRVFNSLGREKKDFVPIDPRGRKITWYCCGPTVYDAGHLGHARNYVTTDILRRIMRDYFGYDVEFVMNITDIDDKIILRARQQHLFKTYTERHPVIDTEVYDFAITAYRAYAVKAMPLIADGLTPESYHNLSSGVYGPVLDGSATLSGEGVPGDNEAKLKMHNRTMISASNALIASLSRPVEITPEEFYAGTSDVLLPYLDSLEGSSIRHDDYGIFSRLTQYWEGKFREDMKSLNCLPPTITTRVTEFVDEVAAFVKRIEQKGFAYATSDGSVYFDIKAFENAGNTYARLEPWNRNDKDLQADGEGSLTKTNTEKKSDADFVLWKASKSGEPSWNSSWGRGRPGWHIECSAMASEVLGGRIDIHSGGIDLAFPHHDNELAQSEAYWVDSEKGLEHHWINYFLHMGHLSIQGSKMSKSLKNFTTIDDALKRKGGWTARGLRIVFLLGGWKERIEVTEEVISRAGSWESNLNKYFANVNALVAEQMNSQREGVKITELFGPLERQLRADLDDARIAVDDALRDSFNTPAVMASIEDIVSKTNVYISKRDHTNSLAIVEEVARWVTRLINIFGLDASTSGASSGDRIGWASSSGSCNTEGGVNETANAFVRAVSKYRDGVRTVAMENPTAKKALLDLSDDLRDNAFFNMGVGLDDREEGKAALVKFTSKEELKAQRDQKEADAAAKATAKAAKKAELDRIAQEKAEKGKLSPADMFRTAEFSAWDEDGLPTIDGEGQEITKNRSKKLRKDWERQKKLHDEWKRAAEKV